MAWNRPIVLIDGKWVNYHKGLTIDLFPALKFGYQLGPLSELKSESVVLYLDDQTFQVKPDFITSIRQSGRELFEFETVEVS